MSPWGKVAFAQCYYFIFFMAMPKIQDLRPMQMHYDNIFYFPLNYTLIYGSICNVHFLQCFLQTGGQEGGQQTYWSSSVDQRQSHTLGMENVGPTIETCCILVTSFYFQNYWFAMTLVWVKWLPTDAPKERLWLDFLNKCGHWRYHSSLNAGICSRCRIFFSKWTRSIRIFTGPSRYWSTSMRVGAPGRAPICCRQGHWLGMFWN